MTKNPIINALLATLYIATVACIMFYGSHFAPAEDTLLIPIAMLSLFSLSAAVMAFVFFYQPIVMFLEGEKKTAIQLAIRTIGTFAVITAILFALLLAQSLLLKGI